MKRVVVFHRRISNDRHGFSMVELIVVMAIVALLLALGIPAVGQARRAVRRVQCVNNLRNITFGLTQFDHYHKRLPASGNYFDPEGGGGNRHHSWAVSILPFLDQGNLYNNWQLDRPITDPLNQPLTRAYIPVYVCPLDITRSDEREGDLSYAVNGGWGFTIRTGSGVRDCPIDPTGTRLDLNGDGASCAGTDADDEDRRIFKQLGLFFLENWGQAGPDATVRRHSISDIHDGTSQTFLVGENVRAGVDPADPTATFADPNPYRSAFYVGNPCAGGTCSDGNVDYSRCNAGESKINSGLWSPEGRSPVPNSFHPGGVHMAYADGHVKFLSELIHGAVYAALSSPQGMHLNGTPLQQVIASEDQF